MVPWRVEAPKALAPADAGPSSAPLQIVWINLDRRTDRADYMRAMLRRATASYDGPPPSMRRFAAVTPRCPEAAGVCDVGARSPLPAAAVAALETAELRGERRRKREGLLGCWLSHLAALLQLNASSAPPQTRLLLLEDDVVVRPGLFRSLGRLLAPAGPDWHACRLSTWGDFHGADLVAGSRRLYRAVERPPDPETLDPADPARHMYYMGTHAVLVQKRTVGPLLERMLRVCGAESPDGCAYRVGAPGARNGTLADGGPFRPFVLRVPELLDRPTWAYDDSDAGRPENGRVLPGDDPLPVES